MTSRTAYQLAAGAVAAAALLLLYTFAPAQVVTSADPPKGIACAYNSSPPTAGSSGVAMWVQCDSTGKIITTTSGGTSTPATHVAAAALGTSQVLKASAGTLFSYNCTGITGGSAGYCIAVNATSAPSTGAVSSIDWCYFAAGAAGCALAHLPSGVTYSTGITILISSASTPYTYTTGTLTGAISGDIQ